MRPPPVASASSVFLGPEPALADQTRLTALQPQLECVLDWGLSGIPAYNTGALCSKACMRCSTKGHPSRVAVQRMLAPTVVASSYVNPNSHLPKPWDLKHRSDYHGYVMLLFVVVWRVCLATLRVPAPPQFAPHEKNPQLAS